MFDAMVDALRKGEGIEIRGFGSFSIRAYKEYQGRNPRTGEAVHVRPKRLRFLQGWQGAARARQQRPAAASAGPRVHADADQRRQRQLD